MPERVRWTYQNSDAVVEGSRSKFDEMSERASDLARGAPMLLDESESTTDIDLPDDLSALTVPELESLAGSLGVEEVDIDGSGAGGNVLKADWIETLEAFR